ncbi:unnamed protein product [Closterium sp. NIES-54]
MASLCSALVLIHPWQACARLSCSSTHAHLHSCYSLPLLPPPTHSAVTMPSPSQLIPCACVHSAPRAPRLRRRAHLPSRSSPLALIPPRAHPPPTHSAVTMPSPSQVMPWTCVHSMPRAHPIPLFPHSASHSFSAATARRGEGDTRAAGIREIHEGDGQGADEVPVGHVPAHRVHEGEGWWSRERGGGPGRKEEGRGGGGGGGRGKGWLKEGGWG